MSPFVRDANGLLGRRSRIVLVNTGKLFYFDRILNRAKDKSFTRLNDICQNKTDRCCDA